MKHSNDGLDGLWSLAGWELIAPVPPDDPHELARRHKERRGAAERLLANLHGTATETARKEVEIKLARLGAFVSGEANKFTAYYPAGNFETESSQTLAGELFEAQLRVNGPVWPEPIDLTKADGTDRSVLFVDTTRHLRLIRTVQHFGPGSADIFYRQIDTLTQSNPPAAQA